MSVGPLSKKGLHPINSIFHSIGLYDEINIKLSSHNDLELINNTSTPIASNHNNLALRAAEKILKNQKYGLSIKLIKNIPAGSGLGGGSADAAAILVGANQLYGLGNSTFDLCKMAAELGSDVPFFLYGGCALVSGFGEKIVTFGHSLAGVNGVIVVPDVSISTARAYNKLDKKFKDTKDKSRNNLEAILKSIKQKNIKKLETCFFNDFELILNEYAEIIKIKEAAKEIGLKLMLTGSGSSLFGFIHSEQQKIEITNRLNDFSKVIFVNFKKNSLNY